MSILLKDEIEKGHQDGSIFIEPYNPEQLGSNSYGIKLDNTLKVYNTPLINGEMILDVKKINKTKTIHIPAEGIILRPGILYLGNTIEAIGSDHFIPRYQGRRSVTRLGIQSHISGFGDIGFKKKWTLEIVVIHPIRIYAGMKLGQISFHRINEKSNNCYNVKCQVEPQQSKSYLQTGPVSTDYIRGQKYIHLGC